MVLFYRPTKKLIDLNGRSMQNQMSIFVSQREELVDVQFSEKFKEAIKAIHDAEERNSKSLKSEEPNLVSIDELLWKEMICDKKELLSLYTKLAKARLTGKCCGVSSFLSVCLYLIFIYFCKTTDKTLLVNGNNSFRCCQCLI